MQDFTVTKPNLVQVEGEQRELVGKMGAIEKLLNIIKEKLRLGVSFSSLLSDISLILFRAAKGYEGSQKDWETKEASFKIK